MKVTQAKRLDYLVQLHSAVITGLIATGREGMGIHVLEESIGKNKIAPVLNTLLDTLIETEEAVTAMHERNLTEDEIKLKRYALLNGENRL